MKKALGLFTIVSFICLSSQGQLMVSKLVGKNSENTKLGFGLFAFYEFPLNDEGNRAVRLELLDFAYFPSKNEDLPSIGGYVSIKLGYKYIFSESKTGFYLEPQAGYCRTVLTLPDADEGIAGDGVALAMEGGYSLEVGEQGNTFNFGLKYEHDIAAKATTISSVGFRVSYSFGLFKRRQ